MTGRTLDGSAGDADYGIIGTDYSAYRRPDPRIALVIAAALAGARTVLNVGAGAGSYESADFEVTAVEPSESMRAQRPAHLPAAIDATAENLPFPDGAFDAAMATFSVHQWSDVDAGLAEMRRVTRGPVLILTCDPALVRDFWLYEYAPLVLDAEARRYPPVGRITAVLGGSSTVTPVPIPVDCTDGFNEAYYARPEKLLDPGARLSCSAWSFVPPETVERYIGRLRRDLADGTWDDRHGPLRARRDYEGSLVLIRAVRALAGAIRRGEHRDAARPERDGRPRRSPALGAFPSDVSATLTGAFSHDNGQFGSDHINCSAD